MTTTKKLVIAVVALSLALVAFAGTTLAWLTASSDEVKNTFTYGKVALTLDEAKVDAYGDPVTGADRVTANQYKLIPGEEYTKDPIVHVTKGSEPCYVYVEVVNGLKDVIVATTIEDQMKANDWVNIEGTNIWYYKNAVDALNATADIDLKVFGSFKLTNDVDVATYKDAEITVKAYAVQSANIGGQVAAWEATFGTPAATETTTEAEG